MKTFQIGDRVTYTIVGRKGQYCGSEQGTVYGFTKKRVIFVNDEGKRRVVASHNLSFELQGKKFKPGDQVNYHIFNQLGDYIGTDTATVNYIFFDGMVRIICNKSHKILIAYPSELELIGHSEAPDVKYCYLCQAYEAREGTGI